MSNGASSHRPFEPLKALEAHLLGALRQAEDSETRNIRVSATGVGREVRATFLRWFLLEALPASGLVAARFELRDAEVVGSLDLAGTELKTICRFVTCTFPGEMHLSDASFVALHLIGGEAVAIQADRIDVSGTLAIRAVRPTDNLQPPVETPAAFVVTNQIRLSGAKIRGNLDLRGCVINARDNGIPLLADGLLVEGNALLADRFKASGEVRLNGCRIMRNLDCSGAKLKNPRGFSLSAAGAEIDGTLYLSRTRPWATYVGGTRFYSEGVLRLEGAKIHGDLDCTGGSFLAPAYAAGSFSQSDLDDEDKLKAIAADGVDVGNDLICRTGFHARGAVSLIGAHVGGDFGCEDGYLDHPGEQALSADGISVSGTTFFTHGARTNGTLCFTQASFKQGFYAIGAIFEVSSPPPASSEGTDQRGRDTWEFTSEPTAPACGIDARSVAIEGPFRWLKIEKKKIEGAGATMPLWLYLAGSKAEAVEDDRESWEILDRFDVTGCDYSDISSLTGDIHWRLRELDRQYAILNASGGWAAGWRALSRAFSRLTGEVSESDRLGRAVSRFFPQPYIQFAKILRDAGYESAANDVIVRLERNKTRYSDLGVRRQLARWSLDLGLRYGFAPFRPIWVLMVCALLSAACFEIAYSDGLIVPTKDNQETFCPVGGRAGGEAAPAATGAATAHACDGARVSFNALIYAIDTLIPLVDLNQKKNWVVEPLSADTRGRSPTKPVGLSEAIGRELSDRPEFFGPGTLVIFNTFFGWLMTTFFAAGITGLLRSGKDSD